MKTMETVWTFSTQHFMIALEIQQVYGYQYDGYDENCETQSKLDNGEYIAFDSQVVVYLDGQEIGRDGLGESVYEAGKVSEFWTAHRDKDPMNRNCSAFRATHGQNACICHYFPAMVKEATRRARAFVATLPKLRK